MHAIHRSRTSSVRLVALLAFALFAPFPVSAEDQPLAAAPAEPSWGETSGYDAVEASRATASALISGTADTIDPMVSVSQNRLINARRALESSNLGSMQEDALTALVASGATRDEAHGYSPSQAEASRIIAAERALESGDLGGMQEQALVDVVAAGLNRGATRNDGSGEDLRADQLAQFRAIELALSSSLGAAHQETSDCVSVP